MSFGVFKVTAIAPGGKSFNMGFLFGELELCVFGAWHHWKQGNFVEGEQPTKEQIEAPETLIKLERRIDFQNQVWQ